MAASVIPLCEFDDDHIQGTAVGPTHGDVIVTAQEDGVLIHSTVSMVSVGQAGPLSDDSYVAQIACLSKCTCTHI